MIIMEHKLDVPFKIGDEVYIIINSKIEIFYLQKITIENITEEKEIKPDEEMSYFIFFELNRYNDGVNFYEIKRCLTQCFKNREDLMAQL